MKIPWGLYSEFMGTKGVAFNCSDYGITRFTSRSGNEAHICSRFHFRICFVFFG
jgi:hypothetical protein